MPLNSSTVGTLFRAEMRMVLRDRRILITSFLLPMLITPALLPILIPPMMFLGSHWTMQKRQQKLRESIFRYAVAGSEQVALHTLLASTRERLESASNRSEE